MRRFDVPGTRLPHETLGSGPTLLLVPRVDGPTDPFGGMGERLAEYGTVATYERWSISRSQFAGPPDDAHELEADAEDGQPLVEHVSAEPASVFGSGPRGVVVVAFAGLAT